MSTISPTQMEKPLQDFLDALETALRASLPDADAFKAAFERLERNVKSRNPIADRAPQRQPACQYVERSYDAVDATDVNLQRLARAIQAIEPALQWSNAVAPGQPSFLAEAYAEAMIVGPGGLAESNAVEIGLSIMAPNTNYPDHKHPPEELYIALSEGDWRQNADPWVTPGPGGLIHNPAGIVHAMRSGDKPLFAIWCLPLP